MKTERTEPERKHEENKIITGAMRRSGVAQRKKGVPKQVEPQPEQKTETNQDREREE